MGRIRIEQRVRHSRQAQAIVTGPTTTMRARLTYGGPEATLDPPRARPWPRACD
jgi:hypothetical protein